MRRMYHLLATRSLNEQQIQVGVSFAWFQSKYTGKGKVNHATLTECRRVLISLFQALSL